MSDILGGAAELGLVGLALVVIVMLVDVIRKRYRQSSNGDRRRVPTVVNCPNKVEGLDATLRAVAKQSGAQTTLLNECTVQLRHNGDGIDRLVEQHKPTLDGRETWKVSPRSERLQEESRDLLRELVAVVKQGGR